MTSRPKVSILLTCYNHIAYLPAALEGVRSQTFRDYEVIAIDDGSKDGSREWLTENAGDCRVVLNERNLGTYGTLNEALRYASGDFIAILNDDDLWAPRKLEAQIDLFQKHPEVGLVHTNGGFIDGEGKPIEGKPLGFWFPTFETGDVLWDLFYENKIIASAALVRRECFEKLGGFNEKYFGSGDWEMWFRIAQVYSIGCVDEPLTFYRVHGANASHKLERIWKDDVMLREWIASKEPEFLGKLEKDFEGKDASARLKLFRRYRNAMCHNFAALGTVRTLNGDKKGGRRAYAQSIRRNAGRAKSYARWLATFLPAKAFRKLL